jgi:hypothetical protein
MPACRLLGLALLLPLASLGAEPIRVTGRALDAEKVAGVQGVQVELFPAWESYEEAVRRLAEKAVPPLLASARTDSTGFFEVAAPESGFYRLVVRAEGYLPMELPLAPLVGDLEIEPAMMTRASPLEVRVVGREGRPLAGVEVRLTSQDPWGASQYDRPERWHSADRRGISGADGRLALLRQDDETPVLTATSPPFLGQSWTGKVDPTTTFRLVPQTVRIESRDLEGRPVPGALVRWEGRPVAVTGPDGRLEIGLPAGVPLTLEGREGKRAQLVRTDASGTGVMPVRLEPPRHLAGRVIDAASQRPVAGAVVWSGWPLEAPAVRANAEGLFQLEVPAWTEVWLETAAAGYLPGERQHVKRAATGPVALRLRPAATLSGVVVDGAGKPIAGAQVATTFFRKGSQETLSARSRANGGFRLTGLTPGGAYELTAKRQGFACATAKARTASPGQPSPPVRIVMGDGQTAFGRVVDEAGRPVTGAEVALVSGAADGLSGWERLTATSDAEGRFEFHHLSPGLASLGARHPDYPDAELPGIQIPPGTPRVDLGNVTLPAGAVIEGRVTDTQGAPIAGAKVRISTSGEMGFTTLGMGDDGPPLQEVQTEKDGGFRVPGLRRDKRFNIAVQHPDYVEALVSGVKAPTEELVRVEMKAAHGLAGRVVGPEGEPVAGASLSRAVELETLLSMDPSNILRPLGVTDAEGGFAVTGLAPGPLNLQVRAEGYQSRRVDGLQIPEDRDLADVKIALERGAWLAVRVLSTDGEPVPGVQVTVLPDEKTLARYEDPFSSLNLIRTDAHGACRVNLPGPGSYNVVVSGNRSLSQNVKAGAGATPVELRFPLGVEVSGRVLGEDGAVVPGAFLQLSSGEEEAPQPSTVSTEADGTFVFSDVADGKYGLTAHGGRASGKSNPVEIEVAGQPVRNLELRLARKGPPATLTGRLLGLTPEELTQVWVSASQDSFPRQGTVDREGSYRIEGLWPGEWTVEAFLFPSGREAQGTVQIDAATPAATLDLEFPAAGFTVTGRVLVDGSPLANALVFAGVQSSKSDYSQGSRTAYDGTFMLTDVPAGTLILGVLGPEGIGGVRTIQVAESREVSIEFATGRLSGRIVAASGEPLEDASIEFQHWSPEAQAAGLPLPGLRSGADGTFTAPRMAAGPYKVTVQKEGFASADMTVEVPPGGEGIVEIRLPRKGPS